MTNIGNSRGEKHTGHFTNRQFLHYMLILILYFVSKIHITFEISLENRFTRFSRLVRSRSLEVPKLPQASDEQNKVIAAIISNGKNVLLNSVAGSGKTTTTLHIAAAAKGDNVLLLTYNARLKWETRAKAKTLALKNLEVHSYHSMGVSYYDSNCRVDTGLRETVEQDKYPYKNYGRLKKYRFIVLDESQDMNHIFYAFVSKIIRDLYRCHRFVPKLLVVGDHMQCVYDFQNFPNKADSRFLTLSNHLFLFYFKQDICWERLYLTTSYRLTKSVAKFVSEVMLNEPNSIVATKEQGPPVKYLVGCPFTIARWIGNQIVKHVKAGKVKPHEIFILAPSIRSKSRMAPLQILENILVENEIPVYVESGAHQDKKCSGGKVIFSSFHQSKGLERRWVFVFEFQTSYFDFYAKNGDRNICPGTLYVAATRATEFLCLVAENSKGSHLPFLNRTRLVELAGTVLDVCHADELYRTPLLKLSKTFKFPKPGTNALQDSTTVNTSTWSASTLEKNYKTPYDIIRFLAEPVIARTIKCLECKTVQRAITAVQIPSTVPGIQSDFYENVADLNGLAIPAMLQAKYCGGWTTIHAQLLKASTNMELHQALLFRVQKLPPPEEMKTPSHFLEVSALYQAAVAMSSRGYLSKVLQLKSFDWMKQVHAEPCLKNIENTIKDCRSCEFEVPLEAFFDWKEERIHVRGMADIISPTAVWEIKCVKSFEDEHFLQLAIYAWLWKRNHIDEQKHFMLFNPLNNELCEINGEKAYDAIEHILFPNFFLTQKRLTDKDFVQWTRQLVLGKSRF